MLKLVPFTIDRFRDVLRATREELVGARDTLAEITGVNRTTIQSAEMGPKVPKLDTVARLVEGMGLTLTAFFARIDDRPPQDAAVRDVPPLVPEHRGSANEPLAPPTEE